MLLAIPQSERLFAKHGVIAREICDKCGIVLGGVRFTRCGESEVYCSRGRIPTWKNCPYSIRNKELADTKSPSLVLGYSATVPRLALHTLLPEGTVSTEAIESSSNGGSMAIEALPEGFCVPGR